MTRNLPAVLSDEVEKESIAWALFLELALDSGAVNIWSGTGDFAWGGKTWSGIGTMGTLSGVSEDTDLADVRIEASLSLHEDVAEEALPDLLTEFKDNDPVGRVFTLYLGFFEVDSGALLDDPMTLTAGFIDEVKLSEAEVNLTLASEQALMARNRIMRLTDQDQRALFPGDAGLEFVTSLDEEIKWGSAPPQKISRGRFSGSGGIPSGQETAPLAGRNFIQ